MTRIVVFPVVINENDKAVDAFVADHGLDIMKRIQNIIEAKDIEVTIEGPKYELIPVIVGKRKA